MARVRSEEKTSPQGMGAGKQFGDTTLTKVFVGGLAWETQRETMKSYFDQFGEILEAVVITDKNTGRSKGYGFVTFRDATAAKNACADAAPVIDGRRANCNIASLGVQRSTKPTAPRNDGRNFGVMMMKSSFTDQQLHGGAGVVGAASFASPAASTFPHYNAVHQAVPYHVYGYSPYSPEYSYPGASYYDVFYGGVCNQYPVYGSDSSGLMPSGVTNGLFYPYFQFNSRGGGSGGATYAQVHGHGVQYSPAVHPYSTVNSTARVVTAQPAGMTSMGLLAPTPPPFPEAHHPSSYSYRLVPAQFSPAVAPAKLLA